MDKSKKADEKIVVLGSTGSIGQSTARVLREAPGRFVLEGVAAGRAGKRLFEQIDEFSPERVVLRDSKEEAIFRKKAAGNEKYERVKVSFGPDGLVALVSDCKAGKVLNALTGAAGVPASLAAVENGKTLLLANKEALVAAGSLIMSAAKENGAAIIPVDSEHSAIFQCLKGERHADVERIFLTASGGPFFKEKDFGKITPEIALRHPRWSMGPKVTIDSATLMNKGLEIIEAAWLFDLPVDKIKVVVHPECIVHSMVEYSDGVTIAQLSYPDMKFPISYALHYPERAVAPAQTQRLDFAKIGTLNFHDPDVDRFPCLGLAIESARLGGLIPAMLSAADEVAVEAFLDKKISFTSIARVLEYVLERGERERAHEEDVSLETLETADRLARATAAEAVAKHETRAKSTSRIKPKLKAKTLPEKGSSRMNNKETRDFLLKHEDALPAHVAIIMDGNGRWAKERGLPRSAGHKAGAERVRPVIELCRELGIKTLTLFAFSTENWQRPAEEVAGIMKLLGRFIDREAGNLKKDGVRLCFPGSPDGMPPALREKMRKATEITSENYKTTLNVCVNYGGRDEILTAIKKLMKQRRDDGLDADDLKMEDVSSCLYTAGTPDPDVLIRTGGDNRVSNFLLWQIAYAEIFFHPKFWPDFGADDLAECIRDYVSRERRFGKIEEKGKYALLPGIDSPEDVKKLPGDALDALASEVRDAIISKVSTAGGHLASNLGVVELTIALHRVFDSPRDKFVWDVGHQCYAHKLLTGRFKDFDTLRARNGISGFPKRLESEHDCFDTGHGSTSLSAALGMSVARDLKNEDSHVIGICGDGAMSGGMIFEALNHAGELKRNMIVILNDNSFSISPVTGALGRSLSKLRTSAHYVKFHQMMEHLKEKPSGVFRALSFLTSPARSLGKYLAFRKNIIFEELGFKYVGPIDGHDIQAMTEVLENVKEINGPVLVHVLTKKGKGYVPAESDPASYHGIKKISDGNGNKEEIDIRPAVTYTSAFSACMKKLCEKDERVMGVTAAMPGGTGLEKLIEEYPERFFDVGMAEQHAVTFAAGLAARGMRPVVAIYSTFLQRAYDQIFHDVCLQDLPVIFAIDRAGLVSKYGQTHQGIMDIAYARHLPNIQLLAPRDTVELEAMMEYALSQDHPVAVRYPSGADAGPIKTGARAPIEHATAEMLKNGKDAAVWAVGPMAMSALKAARSLQKQGIDVRVLNARFVQPMDEATLLRAYEDGIRKFFTVEDHLISSGFGSLFLETANALGLNLRDVVRIGVRHSYVPDDSRDNLLADFGLDSVSIEKKILESVTGEKAGKTIVPGK